MFRNRTLTFCLATLLLLVAGAATALVQPEETPLRSKTFAAPDLYIGSLFLTEEQLASQAKAAPFGGLDSLGLPPGAGYLDPRSGRWGTLMPSVPMVPGMGNSLEAASGDSIRIAARDAFMGWLRDHADNLGIDMDEVSQPKITVHRDGALIQLHSPRQFRGVTVRDSYLHAVINNGNLVLFGAIKWGDVNAAPVAIVGAGSARDIVDTYLGDLSRSLVWQKRQLVYVATAVGADPRTVPVGQGYSYRLAWNFWGVSATGIGEWEALVDAHDGSMLAFNDRLSYAEDPLFGAGSTREVQGGVLPVTNDGSNPGGIEHTLPTPFTNIELGGETFFSNSGGNLLACVDGTIESNLDGPYITINDNCGATSESTAGAVLDFGTNAGTDCATPPGASAGNTRSSRSGFYEINRVMEIGRSYLPDNSFLQDDLGVNMNIDSNCNASSGAELNFFTSGGGCSNTGEIAGVFDHEWGHSMDRGDATPGVSSPGEGIADIYAAIRLNDSCIGFNFRPGVACGGYGDPCVGSPACSGVRDIDWANRQSGAPHDIAWIDANCTGGGSPCGGSVHCEGAVYAESVWDLWKRDLTSAPFSMDDLTAQTLVTRLTFEGSGGVGTWYNCVGGTGTGDGCNADGGYLNYLAADDDDGNLANGTPHMDAIFDSFDRHGIACPTPTVTTAGCTDRPTTSPTLSASPIDRGADLSWTAVADAVEYQLYRTEGVFGCEFGKKLVATTTDLSFVDDELNNGTEYYYTVVAVGAGGNSCIGPASSCTNVTPAAGANLAPLVNTAAFTINTGDGDSFLDSCEEATMTIDVDNIGSGSLTNVRIDSVTSPSHPAVDASISNAGVFAANLASCATAQASFDFAAVGISAGDTLSLEINFTADELAGQVRTATVNITTLEGDLQNFPTITFDFEADQDGWTTVEGTFDRSAVVGGGDGTSFAQNSSTLLNLQCDRSRSPLFVPAANTTMTMFTNYDIEDFDGQWWDRANVSTIDENGDRNVVTPSSGRGYDTLSPDAYSGCNSGEHGWAGTSAGNSWASSTFSAAALGSGGLAGGLTAIEVVYSTDEAAVERGFAFDQVTLTNVDIQVDDTQANCATFDGIFSDGFESGNTSAWSATVGGTP